MPRPESGRMRPSVLSPDRPYPHRAWGRSSWACLLAGATWLLGAAGCAPTSTPEPSRTPEPTFLILPSPSVSPTISVPAATPVPLPTVGPTATPIVHVIREGETLIGIAVHYGVTVEGIQALNGNLQPQVLQIGQQLIIPAPASDANAGLLPSPTPVGVTLGPVSCYETPVGTRWCFLEARNPTGQPVENVSALVTLVARDGRPMLTDVAYSPANLLPPDGSLPLTVLFGPTVEPPAAAVAQLVSAETSPGTESRYLPVQVLDQAAVVNDRTATVTGVLELAAGTSGPARLVVVVLSLYNQRGEISGLRQLTLEGEWPAGQTQPFELSATALAGAVDHFELTVEAQP